MRRRRRGREASEIVARVSDRGTEAAKDVVYLRKLVKGLDASEPGVQTTQLASADSKSAHDISYNRSNNPRASTLCSVHITNTIA